MSRPLIIGPEQRVLIANLIRIAEADVIPYETMKARHEAQAPVPPDNLLKTISIPTGFDVTFTIEEHAPGVEMRHISVSVPEADRAVSVPGMDMLLEEFGFRGRASAYPLNDMVIWEEPFGNGLVAINLLERVGTPCSQNPLCWRYKEPNECGCWRGSTLHSSGCSNVNALGGCDGCSSPVRPLLP